ncbi:MAG: PPC domain-containing protein [Anaerolineae bacterium]|nr:PPC domain-containing protein [Anaerolineae bacterium]
MDATQPLGVRVRLVAGILCLLLGIGQAVQAQERLELIPFTPTTGQIESGASQTWTFTGLNSAVLSFRVEAVSGDLDPMMALVNSAGQTLITNDDYEYPVDKDALLETITLPRTDTYSLTVSGYGDTAGEYLLTMTNGFADLKRNETFDTLGGWTAVDESLQVSAQDGQIGLQVTGPQIRGITTNTEANSLTDYYAQVDVSVVSQVGGWTIGLTARQQEDGNYYLFSVNDRGSWRFIYRSPDGEETLRDWTTHPAIIAGTTRFSLGMMINDTGYDFFYDGQFLGHVVDDAILNGGQIGLVLETGTQLNSQANAQFDNLIVTAPVVVNGQRLIPQQIIQGEPTVLVEELRRHGLIPAAGEMALTVAESFAEYRNPGISRFMLGRGTTFTDFALGTTVSWEVASAGVTGCGLIFRQSDDSHYVLAYVDATGGYGLSQRDGDSFLPGIFGERPQTATGTHQLVIVATGQRLLYYLDGLFAGELEQDAVEGQIGNAVVNFEPISTSCQFNNTWLWRWR